MTAAERFARARDAVHGRLPAGLQRLIPSTVIGFAVLNGFTYAVDLSVLGLIRASTHWPYAVATTIGYLTAFTLAFLLNRWLNFQAHGRVGQQTGRYALAVVVNFVLFLQVLGNLLVAQGVPDIPARMIAGLCEGIFMYCAMRWFVFRPPRADDRGPDPRHRPVR